MSIDPSRRHVTCTPSLRARRAAWRISDIGERSTSRRMPRGVEQGVRVVPLFSIPTNEC